MQSKNTYARSAIEAMRHYHTPKTHLIIVSPCREINVFKRQLFDPGMLIHHLLRFWSFAYLSKHYSYQVVSSYVFIVGVALNTTSRATSAPMRCEDAKYRNTPHATTSLQDLITSWQLTFSNIDGTTYTFALLHFVVRSFGYFIMFLMLDKKKKVFVY